MSEREQMLVNVMLSHEPLFLKAISVIKPEYFDPELRNAVKMIVDYYEKYSGIPHFDIIKGETSVEFKPIEVTPDIETYATDSLEQLCKTRALELAVIEGFKLIQKGDQESLSVMIDEARQITFNKDLGIEYFSNPRERLENEEYRAACIPCGIDIIDEMTGGGPCVGETIMFTANSGQGKSITLSNIALNYVERGQDVVYITLELNENAVSQRFDKMLTGLSRSEIPNHIESASTTIYNHHLNDRGRLFVRRIPYNSPPSEIVTYLRRLRLLTGCKPTILVIDYLDIVGCPDKRISPADVFTRDKITTEYIREMGVSENYIVFTASQQNRGAIDAKEANQSHIAGGISKTNTVDYQFSIKFTPEMQKEGEYGLVATKTRSSSFMGEVRFCNYDMSRLRIINADMPIKTRKTVTTDSSVVEDRFKEMFSNE